MERNLIDFTEVQKDKPIFRYLSKERLFELFEKHSNTLVSPKLWKDDPYEEFISTAFQDLKKEDEKEISIGFLDNIFGQSWTQKRESDAMWRIYSPNENGARITTTPRKLLKSLYDDSGNQINDYSCFLGKVKYCTTPKLKKVLIENVDRWIYFDTTGRGLAQSLLLKRKAFDYENEVRLLFNNKFKGGKSTDLYSYRFNPLEVIDDIVFDPRINYSEFKKHKERLLELRFNKRIVKSNLRQVPEFVIKSKN